MSATAGEALELTVVGPPNTPVLEVAGDIDIATSGVLRKRLDELLALGATSLTLDLHGVAFIDSSGLGVLVGTFTRLRDAGGQALRVVGAQDNVRRVLEITGLDEVFTLEH